MTTYTITPDDVLTGDELLDITTFLREDILEELTHVKVTAESALRGALEELATHAVKPALELDAAARRALWLALDRLARAVANARLDETVPHQLLAEAYAAYNAATCPPKAA